jgi:branched-chain amino acid transport system substrate-binding protein
MKRMGWTVLVVACVMLALSSSGWAAERPIRILVLEGLSGPAKDIGERVVLGSKFAVEEVNAQGGVNGRKVELIAEDNQGKPDVGARKAQKYLLEGNIDMISIFAGTNIVKAVAQAIGDTKILFLAGTQGDDVTGKDFTYNMFRPYWNVSMFARGVVEYMAKHKKMKTFYLLNQDYSLGRDAAAAYKREIARQIPDGKIVGEDYFPLFTKDLSSFLTKVKASGAEAILTTAWGSDVYLLLKQRQELGVKAPIVCYALSDPFTISAAPESALGTIASDGYAITIDTKENKDFIKRWQEKHKGGEYANPDLHTVRGYMGTKLALEAAKKANSMQVDKIMPVLEGFRTKMPIGEVSIRPCDHQIQMPMVVVEVVSTKYPYIGPATILPASTVSVEESATGNQRCKGK